MNIRKKIKKGVRGITLIALVVTIIVLLILAGVALNLTIGQNGIFQRAQGASSTWKNAESNEQLAFQEGTNLINSYLNEFQGESDEISEVDTVPIPKGFYYVGGTKNTGLVISDEKKDENKYKELTDKGITDIPEDELVGNQFVWVPVENFDIFKTYDGYMLGTLESKAMEQQGINNYWNLISEPSKEEYRYNTELEEYNAMMRSVQINKGFYVARYEAGKEGEKVVSKKGAKVWNDIQWGDSITSIGTKGAVYTAQNMYTDKNTYAVTSTLIYGTQWDAIMTWIDSTYINEDGKCNSFVSNSTKKGNYNEEENVNDWKGKITICGSSDDYRLKNIYDLAGNVFEWTMESGSTGTRVFRGGGYNVSGTNAPVSYRFYDNITNHYDYIGFRVALYL